MAKKNEVTVDKPKRVHKRGVQAEAASTVARCNTALAKLEARAARLAADAVAITAAIDKARAERDAAIAILTAP